MPTLTIFQRLDGLRLGVHPFNDACPVDEWLIAHLFRRLRDDGRPAHIHLHYWLSTSVRGILDDALRGNELKQRQGELQGLRTHVHDMIAIAINLRQYNVQLALSAWRQECHRCHANEDESSLLTGLKLLLMALVYGRGAGMDAAHQLMNMADGRGPAVAIYLFEHLTAAFSDSARLAPDVDGAQIDHEDLG